MATFEINGKEYELKLSWQGVQLLNGLHDGGTYELIGQALRGDFDTFPHIVHAALLHTGEKFSLKAVNQAIESLFDAEKLSFDDIARLSNEVVTKSFFYRASVEKLMRQNPEMKAALEQLLAE